MRERVVPLLQQQSGFLTVIMGVNRESGRVNVTISWETAAARQASDTALRDQRRTAGELMGGNQVSVEEYEVEFIELAEPVAATPT